MIRDFILNQIIKKVRAYVSSIKSYDVSSNLYSRRFNKLTKEEQEVIVIRVIESQSKAIKHGMENESDIRLPYLGIFRIKPQRRIALGIRFDVIKELGYDRWSNLTVDEKAAVNKIVDTRCPQAIKSWRNDVTAARPRNTAPVIKCIFLDKIKKVQ